MRHPGFGVTTDDAKCCLLYEVLRTRVVCCRAWSRFGLANTVQTAGEHLSMYRTPGFLVSLKQKTRAPQIDLAIHHTTDYAGRFKHEDRV